MFNLPEKYGAENYKKQVNVEDVNRLIDMFTTKPVLFDPLFAELVEILYQEVTVATTLEEALYLFQKILHLIDEHRKRSNFDW